MARPERRPNLAGIQQRLIAQAAATAIVQGASIAAAAQETVDAAISGDLIAASPELAATIGDLTDRIVALETP